MGKVLTNLVTNVADPLVIAVDGQWGSGKTTFLKMWAGELRMAGFGVVYFDAFENDYAEEAFTALASGIIALAQAKHKENTPAAKAFLEKTIGAGKVVLSSSLKVGVKLATMGALEAADFKAAATDIGKEASELTEKYLGDLLTKQSEQKNAIEAFRDALAGLPALLSDPPHDTSAGHKPLIIIIDELDRCRPLFALQLLERIKHFFAVPNVHFILGTHLGQLRSSVIAAYGPQIDAQTYLQKFIQVTLHLLDDAQHRHQRPEVKLIDYLLSAMQFSDQPAVDSAKPYLQYAAKHHGSSLRTIEHIMSAFALALASKTQSAFCPIPIIIGLCVLKVIAPDLYVKAKAGALIWNRETKEALGLGFPADEGDRHRIEHMTEWWVYATELNVADDHPLHKKFGSWLFECDIERTRIVPYVANTIVDRLGLT